MRLRLSSHRTSSLRLTRATPGAVVLALASAAAPASQAFADAAACEQFNWPVKREQALFSGNPAITPSGTAVQSPAALALQLKPHAEAGYTMPPAREPKQSPSYGGVITFQTLPKAGAYQVTVSNDAWVDVIQDGKSVASTSHTGQRECPGIRKSVRFDLAPGPVTVQVSGSPATSVNVSLLPAE